MKYEISEKEKTKWIKLIQEFESEIKSGKGYRVLTEVKKMKNIPMDIQIRLQLSNILRRLGQSSWSLVLLRPILKNIFGNYYENKFYSKHLIQQTNSRTDLENRILISYAASLRNIECTAEAMALMDALDEKKYPELLLQKAITHFKKWEYFQAIPLLKKYIQYNENDEYQKLVGLVNIASGYAGLGKNKLSNHYIAKAKKMAEKLKAYLLYGNLLEIEIQNMFFLKKYENVHHLYLKADSYLKNSSGPFLLYLNKWKTLAELHPFFSTDKGINTNPSSLDEAKKKLEKLKAWALRLRNWETVRDVDYYISIMNSDLEALRKMAMLTPHQAFKVKIKKHLLHQNGKLGPIGLLYDPSGFVLRTSPSEKKRKEDLQRHTLNLVHWTWNQRPLPSLKKNSSFYLLLSCLTKNPYRNHSLGVLFSEIFPNQVFDPDYSIERLKKIVSRCNQFLKKNGIPIKIKSSKSIYRMEINSEILFVLQYGMNLSPQECFTKNYINLLLDYQKEKPFPSSTLFTNKILRNLWSCSDRQVRRIVHELVEEKWLIVSGSGRGQKYQLVVKRKSNRLISPQVSSK